MSKPGEIYGRYWSETEYIIVLHFYLKNKGRPRHHLCEWVVDAARLLGRAGIWLQTMTISWSSFGFSGAKGSFTSAVRGSGVREAGSFAA